MTTTDKKARVRKTDAEKAQYAYDVALRRTKKAEALRDSLWSEQQAAQADYEAAKKRSDFLANDPDLPQSKLKAEGLAAGGQVSLADQSQVSS